MLVLSRIRGQSIWIGDYEVKVIEILNGKVRLGIDAPEEVLILRDELRNLNSGSSDPEQA